ENYAVRAERMHMCGLELATIVRDLELFKDGSGSNDDYQKYCSRYEEILKNYENHAEVDYEVYQLKKLDQSNWGTWFRLQLTVRIKQLIDFSRYIIPNIGILLLFYLLFDIK